MSRDYTHCYVASLGCGCGVGIVIDDGRTEEEVAEWRREGYRVERLDIAVGHLALGRKCDIYPHTDWQLRNEAAAAKRRRKDAQLSLLVK